MPTLLRQGVVIAAFVVLGTGCQPPVDRTESKSDSDAPEFPTGEVAIEREPIIPDAVAELLYEKLGSWETAKVHQLYWQLVSELANEQGLPFGNPTVAWGDYNGDSRRDYALQVTYKRDGEQVRSIVAVLDLESGLVFDILSDRGSTSDWMIPVSKGTEGYDYGGKHSLEGPFVYERDAVFLGYGEKSGVSYLYGDSGWKEIPTSD